jgi:hypothetical protein
MNALDYAINEVKNKIPYELLYAGVTYGDDPQIVNLSSVEDKLLQKVIRKRVLLMCNVIGGIEILVPINQLYPSFYEKMYTVYQIPPELIMNKTIVSALHLSYVPGSGFMGNQGGYSGVGSVYSPGGADMFSNNPLINAAGRIGSAAAMSGVLTNAHLEIVAHNTIAVYANYRSLTNFGILVVLENDSKLSNLQPRSYNALGRLCELATKAYIYNKLIVPVNSGYLSGGQDLGVFKSILESFSSAEEDYQTYIQEVWGKVMFLNDTTRTNRFLSSMIAPDL